MTSQFFPNALIGQGMGDVVVVGGTTKQLVTSDGFDFETSDFKLVRVAV
jgi:hypothetical protein